MPNPTYVPVGSRSSVLPRCPRVVTVGRYEVALFDVDGELRAYENACPHQGGPIGEGFVEGTTVTCPWHAWCFDLRTGSMTLGDFVKLRRFGVEVDGDTVYVAPQPDPES